MKTVILYATRHGAAEEAALLIQKKLGEADVFNIKKDPIGDLGGYDTVIVGGSIHAGRIQPAVRKLLGKHAELLLEKRLGLYLCCMYEGETAQEQFDDAFPQHLRDHAVVCGLFGGKFDLEKMSFFERAIVKQVAGVTQSVSKIDKEAIAAFAEQMGGGAGVK